MINRLLIAAGDPSGDLYGSMLIRELRQNSPRLSIDAVGGPLMRKALGRRDAFHFDLASLGVTGFVEPIRRLPLFLRVLRELGALLADAERRPDALVCIDFYGFNRRLLELAKRSRVPAYYFISPQVWASRAGRIRQLKRTVERMLVIFPFEEPLYRRAGVPVSWVGHPLIDLIPPPAERAGPDGRLRLGLLPGSRGSEIRRHLPVFLRAASRILQNAPGAETTVFAAKAVPDEAYTRWLGPWRGPEGRPALLVRESDYALRSRQDILLTSSGTATLENALLGLPMVVVYKLSWPTYWIARALIKVPHIAMANLLAGRALVPELIQRDATPEAIADAALSLLRDPAALAALRRELAGLRARLGEGGAVAKAAGIILGKPSARVAA